METPRGARTRGPLATTADGARGPAATPAGRRTAGLWRTLVDLGLVPITACGALAVALVAARFAWTGSLRYVFLVWNLFLAGLPWAFAVPLAILPSRPGHGWKLLPFFAGWLVFLPNAPYIVTDLLHLRPADGVPLWFDAALLFTFAWTGCLMGFFSLRAVHHRVDAWLGRAAGWAFVVASALLTGFGIYLGRFLRWNSWDVVTRPNELFGDIADRVLAPHRHPQTWAVTLLFAAFVLAAYSGFVRRRSG